MMPHHDETRRLHALSRNPTTSIEFDDHAIARSSQRSIDLLDILSILKRGHVVNVNLRVTGVERWVVHGSDLDSRHFEVVVEPYEDSPFILVVTAWEK